MMHIPSPHWLQYQLQDLLLSVVNIYKFHIRASHLRFLLSKTPMVPAQRSQQAMTIHGKHTVRRSCQISLKVWGDRNLKRPIKTLFGGIPSGTVFHVQNIQISQLQQILTIFHKKPSTKHPIQKKQPFVKCPSSFQPFRLGFLCCASFPVKASGSCGGTLPQLAAPGTATSRSLVGLCRLSTGHHCCCRVVTHQKM